jgi:hypothetical protein
MQKFTALFCASCLFVLTACGDEQSKIDKDGVKQQSVTMAPAMPKATSIPGYSNHPSEIDAMAADLAKRGITGIEAEIALTSFAAALDGNFTPAPVAPTQVQPTDADLAEAARLDNSFFDANTVPPRYQPAQNSDLKTATPQSLFARFNNACKRQSQTALFSEFSYSFRWAFSRTPAADRDRLFKVYCSFSESEYQASLQGKRFFIKKSGETNQGIHKSILCMVPVTASDSECQGGMDVVVENGVLKRDEF